MHNVKKWRRLKYLFDLSRERPAQVHGAGANLVGLEPEHGSRRQFVVRTPAGGLLLKSIICNDLVDGGDLYKT